MCGCCHWLRLLCGCCHWLRLPYCRAGYSLLVRYGIRLQLTVHIEPLRQSTSKYLCRQYFRPDSIKYNKLITTNYQENPNLGAFYQVTSNLWIPNRQGKEELGIEEQTQTERHQTHFIVQSALQDSINEKRICLLMMIIYKINFKSWTVFV